jgi:NADH-quinone oxidoreductase subunit M
MQGAFRSAYLGWVFVAFAVAGVVLAAAYLFKFYRAVFMGDVTEPANANLPDLSRRELATLVILAVPIVAIGLFPGVLFGGMQHSVADVINGITAVVAGR